MCDVSEWFTHIAFSPSVPEIRAIAQQASSVRCYSPIERREALSLLVPSHDLYGYYTPSSLITIRMEGSRRSLKRSRNPLSDLTNHNSSHSSTASAAAPKSKHKPHSLINLPTLTERESASRARPTTRPSNPSPSSAPRPPKSSFLSGGQQSSPISVVYSRKGSSDKRKGKEKAVDVPFSSPPMPKFSCSGKQNLEVESLSSHKAKALTAPCRKKRCIKDSEDVFQHALPQDFIEKQQAYFKEIDDFELPVEEVESVAELD